MRNLRSIALLSLACVFFACEDKSTDGGDVKLPPVNKTLFRVPGDAPTMQAAFDIAEAGDTIQLADGVYSGDGNRDLFLSGKSLIIRSDNGPFATVINCGGALGDEHYGFNIESSAASGTIIDGVTIRGAYYSMGSALQFRSTSPTIKNCVLVNNTSTISGGAIRCKGASPTFTNCTIAYNAGPAGSGVFLIANSTPLFENCMVAFNLGGEAIDCNEGTSLPLLRACDLYGNQGGDWIDCLDSLKSLNNNMAQDPLFCDSEAGNYNLQAASPCLPSNNADSSLIGALGQGCD